MKYFIQRQLNEYGPYTLADLQRYVAQGSILLTDLTRSEGMADWVPVSQVIGNIPVPVAAAPMQTPGSAASGNAYGTSGTVYGGAGTVYGGQPTAQVMADSPIPPDLHWALVLLIGFFCGFFQLAWLFVEAGFVKKIDRESKCIAFLIGAIALPVVGFILFVVLAGATQDRSEPPYFAIPFLLLAVAGTVLHLIGIFQMRSSLENYYNTIEPINLRLSGIMTFFFAVYYFQYHLTRIANWKKTGYLQPQ
jgi:hypothetical protein